MCIWSPNFGLEIFHSDIIDFGKHTFSQKNNIQNFQKGTKIWPWMICWMFLMTWIQLNCQCNRGYVFDSDKLSLRLSLCHTGHVSVTVNFNFEMLRQVLLFHNLEKSRRSNQAWWKCPVICPVSWTLRSSKSELGIMFGQWAYVRQ